MFSQTVENHIVVGEPDELLVVAAKEIAKQGILRRSRRLARPRASAEHLFSPAYNPILAAKMNPLLIAGLHDAVAQRASENFIRAFTHVLALVQLQNISMLTSKDAKAKLAGKVLEYAGMDGAWVSSYPIEEFVEGNDPSALVVAMQKAEAGHLATGEPFIGADGNFFVWNTEKRVWVWQKKLTRLKRELTDQEYNGEIGRIEQQYVYQKELSFCWDVAMCAVNGKKAKSSMYLYVDATPLSEEEFDAFIEDAAATGRFYTTNTRGALIEFLIDNGHIKRLAMVPHEYFEEHGRNAPLAPWWETPNHDILRLLAGMIIRTVPRAIVLR